MWSSAYSSHLQSAFRDHWSKLLKLKCCRTLLFIWVEVRDISACASSSGCPVVYSPVVFLRWKTEWCSSKSLWMPLQQVLSDWRALTGPAFAARRTAQPVHYSIIIAVILTVVLLIGSRSLFFYLSVVPLWVDCLRHSSPSVCRGKGYRGKDSICQDRFVRTFASEAPLWWSLSLQRLIWQWHSKGFRVKSQKLAHIALRNAFVVGKNFSRNLFRNPFKDQIDPIKLQDRWSSVDFGIFYLFDCFVSELFPILSQVSQVDLDRSVSLSAQPGRPCR